MRPLGEKQQRMLESMREHHGWANGCGWIWSNYSEHMRLLESLERRGLVVRAGGPDRERWALSDAGMAATKPWQDALDAVTRARTERRTTEQIEREAQRRKQHALAMATADLLDNHAEEFCELLARWTAQVEGEAAANRSLAAGLAAQEVRA